MKKLEVNLNGTGDFCARSSWTKLSTETGLDPEMEFEAELAEALSDLRVGSEAGAAS